MWRRTMSKTVKTPKGTELPLTNLKGKDYLMVAYRIQWMNEETPNFTIDTNVMRMDKDESVVTAKVTIMDKDGKVIRSASATKREDSKGFADHLEKAETSAVGRALAMLGFGTQFALADLDEGNRLADSPLAATKITETPNVATKSTSSFRKPKTIATDKEIGNGGFVPSPTSDEGWT